MPQVLSRPLAETKREVYDVADAILDRLQVTDRVYHHLRFTLDLVVELGARVRATHPAPARVLIIGSDSLLPLTLEKLGYSVDLWHFREGHLTDEVNAQVTAVVTLEQLAAGDLPLEDGQYDAILAPLVLESVECEPATLLARLKRGLRPSGSLVIVTTNSSRLDLRLKAIAGRSVAADYPTAYVSHSFPPLPRRKYFHRDDLAEPARKAGLRVLETTFIMTHQACAPIDPYAPGPYAALVSSHWLMQSWPAARHAILMHLAPRVGDAPRLDRDADGFPTMSVVVAARRGGEALAGVLSSLAATDYPSDRLETIVLVDRPSPETSAVLDQARANGHASLKVMPTSPVEGPTARNAAMALASGELVAHTDDDCTLPPGWVRTIAAGFDDSTAAVTGPIIELPGSHPDFLVLPGSRLAWAPHEVYPIFNVAYRRAAAMGAQGFDADGFGDAPPRWGWDAELAWRLRRLGWNIRFDKDLFVCRTYPKPGHLEWVAGEFELAQDVPAAVRAVPELQSVHLTGGRFAGPKTIVFDLLGLGVFASLLRRDWRWLLFGVPYVARYSSFLDFWPPTRLPYSARLLVSIGARHLVWVAGLLIGSARARRLVL